MHSLVKAYIGIHAARIGKPYISLLSKGVNESPQKIYEMINNDKDYITLRSMRRTLHIANASDAPMIFHATRRLRIPPKIKSIENEVVYKSREILVEYIQNDYVEYAPICTEIAAKCNVSIDTARLLVKYHWENGLLCLKNTSSSVYHEKRSFGLTQVQYNVNLENSAREEEYNAIQELVCRYIRGFGPVSFGDIVWWTGLSPHNIKKIISQLMNMGLTRIRTDAYPQMVLYLWEDELADIESIRNENPWCKFMSYEDSALKGYKETRYLYSDQPEILFNPIGEIYPTIIVNGKCVGLWSIDFKTPKIEVMPLTQSSMRTYIKCVEFERTRMEDLLFMQHSQ